MLYRETNLNPIFYVRNFAMAILCEGRPIVELVGIFSTLENLVPIPANPIGCLDGLEHDDLP